MFARVLAEMFGPDPRPRRFVLPTRPLHVMYAEPARAFIEARGGDGADRRDRRRSTSSGERCDVASGRTSDGRADAVIAAVPWFALPTLFERRHRPLEPTLDRGARARCASSPIVTVNLWFDRPVLDEPFVGLPGRAMQWVFDKRAVFGGDGVAPVAGVERRVAARRRCRTPS